MKKRYEFVSLLRNNPHFLNVWGYRNTIMGLVFIFGEVSVVGGFVLLTMAIILSSSKSEYAMGKNFINFYFLVFGLI